MKPYELSHCHTQQNQQFSFLWESCDALDKLFGLYQMNAGEYFDGGKKDLCPLDVKIIE